MTLPRVGRVRTTPIALAGLLALTGAGFGGLQPPDAARAEQAEVSPRPQSIRGSARVFRPARERIRRGRLLLTRTMLRGLRPRYPRTFTSPGYPCHRSVSWCGLPAVKVPSAAFGAASKRELPRSNTPSRVFTSRIGGYPPDPQVAVSSTHIVVGANSRFHFYRKAGTKGGTFLKEVEPTALFTPMINAAGLNKTANGKIDLVNDTRAIFDPYRKRFLLLGNARNNNWQELKKRHRRHIMVLAVSVSENPLDGWYTYWWDNAVGWGTNDPAYRPGDMSDYPSIGVDPQSIVTTVWVANFPGEPDYRGYFHVVAHDAAELASGKITRGWHYYGLTNVDGTPAALIQPVLHRGGTTRASFLVSRWGADGLTIWKVENQYTPSQRLVRYGYRTSAWHSAGAPNGLQPGTDAQISFSNLGNSVLKAVFRNRDIHLVTQDARAWGGAASPLTSIRYMRIRPQFAPPGGLQPPPCSCDFNRVFGGGTTGDPSGAKTYYGYPSIEVTRNLHAVIVYTRTGDQIFPQGRVTVMRRGDPDVRPSSLLKSGEAAYGDPGKVLRWGDLTGASVDFVKGKERNAVWVVNQYGAASGDYGLAVGRVAPGG